MNRLADTPDIRICWWSIAFKRSNSSYRICFFLRIQLRIFDLRYLAIKLISALRMSGEIPKEPDDDRSDQDDTSHLVQVLFRFLPHMDHDGFAGRHPIGGSSITKGTSSSLNRKRLKRRAMITASKIPDTYKANNTKLAFFGKTPRSAIHKPAGGRYSSSTDLPTSLSSGYYGSLSYGRHDSRNVTTESHH